MNDFYSGIKDEGFISPWPDESDGGGCQRGDKVNFKDEGVCTFPRGRGGEMSTNKKI